MSPLPTLTSRTVTLFYRQDCMLPSNTHLHLSRPAANVSSLTIQLEHCTYGPTSIFFIGEMAINVSAIPLKRFLCSRYPGLKGSTAID